MALDILTLCSHAPTGEAEKYGLHAHAADVLLSEEVQPQIEKMNEQTTLLYYTRKGWHMIDLLRSIIKGKRARVTICSYSMGEGAARMLANAKADGCITWLTVILDDRTETRTAGSVQVMRVICDALHLKKVHAKITLIELPQERAFYTITGSANYTENYRLETGTIMKNESVYRFYQNILKDEMHGT